MTPTNQPESDKLTCPDCGGLYHGAYEICPKRQQPDTELRQKVEKAFWYTFDAKAKFRPYYTDKEVQAVLDELSGLIAAECQAARISELENFMEWLYNPTDDYQLGDAETWIRNRLATLRSASRKDTE